VTRFRTRKPEPQEKPDVEGARADLERVKRQRPDVERLINALQREQNLNNFTANFVATLRGGH
jgi:hypothetical protein